MVNGNDFVVCVSCKDEIRLIDSYCSFYGFMCQDCIRKYLRNKRKRK